MKIYNEVTLNWDGEVLSEDSFEYEGPLAKCDMGSDVPTQTTTSDPWSAQQPHLRKIFGGAEDFYDQGGANLYDQPLTAGRDPWTPEGEQSIYDYIYGDQFGSVGKQAGETTREMLENPYGAGGYEGLASSDPNQYGLTTPESNAARERMLSGDPFQNPYTSEVQDAFVQDIMEDYNRKIAPQNRSAQIAYQPGGSSRGDLINDRATDDLTENITNATAGFYNDAYQRSLNDQQAGYGLSIQERGLGEQARGTRAQEGNQRYQQGIGGYGDISNTLTGGYAMPIAMGEDRRAFDQENIDEAAFRWDYDQNRDYYNLQDYMGLVQGDYGGQQVTSYDAGVSDLQRGLGIGTGVLGMMKSMNVF